MYSTPIHRVFGDTFREPCISSGKDQLFPLFSFLGTCGSRLQNQGRLRIVSGLGPYMDDLGVIAIPQIVETKAIGFFVYDGFQSSPQGDSLGFVYVTFKDGVLHPLSVGDAMLGHLAKPFAPSGGGSIYIIGD